MDNVRYSSLMQNIVSTTGSLSIPSLQELINLESTLKLLKQTATKRLEAMENEKKGLISAIAVEAENKKSKDKAKEREATEKEKEKQKREKERVKREKEKAERDAEARERVAAATASSKGNGGSQTAGKGSKSKGKASAAASVVRIKKEGGTPAPMSPQRSSPARGSVAPDDDSDESLSMPLGPLQKKQKKKRKRDNVITSDNERERSEDPGPSQASSSMGPPAAPSHRPKIIKLFTSTATGSNNSTPIAVKPSTPAAVSHTPSIQTGSHIDWRLPPRSRSLIPARPTPNPPNPPNSMKQTDMEEDFSEVKGMTQILYTTFHTAVEPYFRPLGEEDLAFLKGYKDENEDNSAYVIPPLGRHYTQVWEDEDNFLNHNIPMPPPPSQMEINKQALDYGPLPNPKFDPMDINDEDLQYENKASGPLSERLAAAFVALPPPPPPVAAQVPVVVDGIVVNGYGDSVGKDQENVDGERTPSKVPVKLSVQEMEDRVKRELRHAGILDLDSEVSWSTRTDDEITNSLRHCQHLLQHQVKVNEHRKAVLLDIAKERLAYGEYQQCLDSLDRIIESGYEKRKKIAKAKEKKSKKDGADKDVTTSSSNQPLKPETLTEKVRLALERRLIFEDQIGAMLRQEEPGRFFGIPQHSVYPDDEEDVLPLFDKGF